MRVLEDNKELREKMAALIKYPIQILCWNMRDNVATTFVQGMAFRRQERYLRQVRTNEMQREASARTETQVR